jgi:hypothetical protein
MNMLVEIIFIAYMLWDNYQLQKKCDEWEDKYWKEVLK